MRFLITFLLTIFCLLCKSQTVVKYYDAAWASAPQDKAVYYVNFIKEGNLYKTNSYWIAGNILHGKSTYADTILQNPIGMQVLYSRKGLMEDSGFYADGKAKYLFHYYPNKQLAMHYYLPENGKDGVIEGYDEDGKKIKNYVFEKEAEFRGGQKAWQSYIAKNATKDLSLKGEDGATTATVQIQFIVDEEGNVSIAKVLKSSGYKEIDKDALRVINESPQWNSAVQYNKPVKAYRVQPITYSLTDKKK
ncbi:MAG: energy transducer TonB [Bacteroidota bacterium]|nr:energy transducer TonB [Bacteroidota bacterium]